MDLERIRVLQRRPARITATFPHVVAHWLFQQATIQGRSVSNFIAHLVEQAMRRHIAESQDKGENQ